MGNLVPCKLKDENEDAWKQQNMEMVENPAYKFVNLARGGSLIDAYNNDGPRRVREIAENEMSNFFYHKDGKRHHIDKNEFLRWRWKMSQRVKGLNETQKISDEKLEEDYKEDYFYKFTPHDACWDLNKRGGVGESPFHLLYLMDSPVHFEVASILLQLYPNLALDLYEGEEYYGESALHIAVVVGDMESVQLLVECGADVNQRATGQFFLPEDQKKGYTGQTDYDGYAYYGEYPLAFAACLGNTDIYDYLLDHGANPNLQDSFGNTVLHMVVISDQTDLYRYAVRHHKRPASTSIKNNQNLTALTLACKLGRHAILKEMLDLDSIEFWRFSTTMCSAHPLRTLDSIGPDGSTNWNSALMIIVNGEKDDHLEMLEGGVMRQLLIEKWKTYAKKRFIMRLILAVIHLALFSIAIYTRPDGHELLEYRGVIDAVRYTSEILVCLSCVATVSYEVMEISTQGITSFFKNCTHAPAQTVYLISCVLILACIPFRFFDLYNVEDVLLILAAPCTWFFLLFFARGHILTGPFVTMIYKMIAGDLFRFGIIYVIFLFGFTQGFFFLFRDVTSGSSDVAKFSTLPETILNLFQMTLGEFKYEVFSLSHYAPLTKIIFALFMILVPILLLNMLIAMMGNTYTQVISKSTKEWWKQWAKIVVVLERGISKKKLLEYQRQYSVKLSGGPTPEDGSDPVEERALVVIKTCPKSRAKIRKGAVFKWKTLGKEIIRQLRQRKRQGRTDEPFELEESLRKGHLLNEQEADGFTSTLAQLAWEKDIDLTKGHPFVTDPDSISPRSPSLQLPSPLRSPASVPNGSAVKDSETRLKAPVPSLGLESQKNVSNEVPPSPVRKRKNLVYNRVSPLLIPSSVKEETTFTDLSDDNAYRDSGSEATDAAFRYPPTIRTERPSGSDSASSARHGSPTRNVVISDEPNHRIIQSEFSFSADSSSATEGKRDAKRHSGRSKRRSHHASRKSAAQQETLVPIQGKEVEVMSSTSSLKEARSTGGSDVVEVRDVESNATGSSDTTPSAAVCWTEETPEVGFAEKKSRKKDKKTKSKGKKRVGDAGSSSSLHTLVESADSKDV